MTDFNKLIPDLAKWNNGNGVSIAAWINGMGDYERAIGYSILFWPKFVEVEGCVFRADVEQIDKWLKAYDGDRRTIEATANHIHLDDLHYGDAEGKTPERLQYLASVLKEIYSCKLKRDFPQKFFRVEVGGDPAAPVLTFYQMPKEEAEPVA